MQTSLVFCNLHSLFPLFGRTLLTLLWVPAIHLQCLLFIYNAKFNFLLKYVSDVYYPLNEYVLSEEL